MSKKAKKIIRITALSLAGLLLVTLITAWIILRGRIKTMLSIRNVGDDLYTMDYQQNYHLDDALAAGIRNEDDLLKFVCDDLFFGYQIEGNFSKYGCAAFCTPAPGGKKLMGRNFDLFGSDTVCVYTHPKDGYAAVSTVSTDMVSVGEKSENTTTSFLGRAALLAAPYMSLDGMNEKGLAVSLLDTDRNSETHLNTEAPELIVTMAIRLMLDRAATVDEAIDLLRQYDIHTAHGWTQHIFIADAAGNTAVAEWHNNEMTVVRYPVCTNFRMTELSAEGDYSGMCERFDLLDKALKDKPENTAEEAMKLLEAAKQEPLYSADNVYTEWSVVFDLTDFTLDYAVNRDYGKVYHLDPRDF
ncbi:MAG: linear amide C-N hydrolase [Ruminococcus sp.]|nr:linear amide C-N hydrolase [Ruminococcus sp.]MBR6874602.1 linear amide C-N hydrolase [Ruminococcus sp.]